MPAKDKARVHQVEVKTMYYKREEEWSSDLLSTDYVDLQESEVAEAYVKRFKSQEIFVKQLYQFPCACGTVQFPNGARPSPLAEANFEQEDDDESAEGDKKDGSSEVAWSTNGDFIEAGATALLRQLKNHGRHHQRRLRPLWPSAGKCESAPRRSSLVRPPPHRQHVPPEPHCWHSPYYLRWFVR